MIFKQLFRRRCSAEEARRAAQPRKRGAPADGTALSQLRPSLAVGASQARAALRPPRGLHPETLTQKVSDGTRTLIHRDPVHLYSPFQGSGMFSGSFYHIEISWEV